MKIYTRTGDDGTTGLIGNERVPKNHYRIEAYGTIDELNATIGAVLANLPREAESGRGWMNQIQSDLFVLGTILATPQGAAARAVLPVERVSELEETIDRMEQSLKPLKTFILPQGIPAAALTHVARSVARRAERRIMSLSDHESIDPVIIPYVNRLADWLFVFSRWVNLQGGGTETAWINPTRGADVAESASPQADRLSTTLQKLEEEKRRRQTLFERTSTDLQKKKDAADRLFRQNVDKIQQEGGTVEKPLRDMDLD
jgi:cob(I)alamin adenosyltransferase